ncbi:MAG TPA: DUF4167 domain-containing protein, partial [Bradyrhizobium sp.]|nr:DUF4167 domain-containing protein [Bradyrhizobium sp.]
LNNNRGNNRRRGRGNNRQQGGQQVNRIDSRARGNAPQLLEKYKKLAHDAHLNGDRVTEEYYLQFADHYFRVIADQRQRQEETRHQRRDDRPQEYGDDYGIDDDIYGEGPPSNVNGMNERVGNDRGGNDRGGSDRGGNDRAPRFERETQGQAPADKPVEAPVNLGAVSEEAGNEEATESNRSIYEPAENPFVRDGRAGRGLKQRKPRRRPREDGEDGDEAANSGSAEAAAVPEGGFDPAALPPSFSKAAEKPAEKPVDVPAEPAAEEKPKRRRTRKAAPPPEGTDDKLEAMNG